tara:strand:- start:68 stop:382 length:315 start_codon:yes stop_codon:yes gene_type:complete
MGHKFYDMDELDIKQLRFIRVNTLGWVLDKFREGTIRKSTIVELIPFTSLESLLFELEKEELYEECVVVFSLMNEIYTDNEKSNECDTRNPFTGGRGMEDWEWR